jgi:hypothetical protein
MWGYRYKVGILVIALWYSRICFAPSDEKQALLAVFSAISPETFRPACRCWSTA